MSDKISLPWDSFAETIGAFVIIGTSIGITGSIILSQFYAGGIATSILTLVIYIFTYLSGPVVALISGIQTARKHGRMIESYVIGGVASGIGYLVMVTIVILIVSLSVSVETGSVGVDTANATGEEQLSDLLIYIIQITIPSVISGIGGVFISGKIQKYHPQKTAENEEISQNKKEKILKWWYVILTIILLGALALPFVL